MSLRQYTGFFLSGFKQSLEYKSDLFGHFIYLFMRFPLIYILWKLIYPFIDNSYLSFDELIIYFFLTFIVYEFGINLLYFEIVEEVKNGNIVTGLIKPINFLWSYFFRILGSRVLSIFITLVLFFIISFFFNVTINYLILFLYLIPFLIFNLLFNLMQSLLAFWITEPMGVRRVIDSISKLCNGQLIPLFLYPEFLQNILKFTPFYYEFYRFALSILGKISLKESFFSIGVLLFWSIIFYFLIKLIAQKGLKKIESLGG